MALAAYRHLLRSTRIAFQGSSLLPSLPGTRNLIGVSLLSSRYRYNPLRKASQFTNTIGDAPLLHAARSEARNNFRKNASLQSNDPALAAAIKHAEEVAQILRQNVVQGRKAEGTGEEEGARYSRFPLYLWSYLLVLD